MATWFFAIIGLLSGLVVLANKVWPTPDERNSKALDEAKNKQDATIRSWINNGGPDR
jgi:hypothetical protein